MAIIHELYEAYRTSERKDTRFLIFINDPANINLLNETDENQQTILHIAAFYNDYDVMYLLLDKPLDVNKHDICNKTPLSYCIDTQFDFCFEVARLLIARGANINEEDECGYTALHFAVLGERLDKLKNLLALGANINQTDNNFETPLKLALKRDFPNKVAMLQLIFSSAVIINQDLTGIVLPSGLSDGVIMVGSRIWPDDLLRSLPVNRTMPGFENAITNAEEFRIAAEADAKSYHEKIKERDLTATRRYHYKQIELMIQDENNPVIKALYSQVIALEIAEELRSPMLRQTAAKNLARLCLFSSNDERIKLEHKIRTTTPPELKDIIDEEITNIIIEKSVRKNT